MALRLVQATGNTPASCVTAVGFGISVAYPWTIAGWAVAEAGGALVFMTGINGNHYHYLSYSTSGVAISSANGGAAGTATTTARARLGQWGLGVGVLVSATERHAYLDGGNKATNTSSFSPGTDPAGNTHIGAIRTASNITAGGFRGLIGEIAIWNVALSDNEVAELYARGPGGAAGIQAANLQNYWRFNEYQNCATSQGLLRTPARHVYGYSPAASRERLPHRREWRHRLRERAGWVSIGGRELALPGGVRIEAA